GGRPRLAGGRAPEARRRRPIRLELGSRRAGAELWRRPQWRHGLRAPEDRLSRSGAVQWPPRKRPHLEEPPMHRTTFGLAAALAVDRHVVSADGHKMTGKYSFTVK